jgi:hypothetical protein
MPEGDLYVPVWSADITSASETRISYFLNQTDGGCETKLTWVKLGNI